MSNIVITGANQGILLRILQNRRRVLFIVTLKIHQNRGKHTQRINAATTGIFKFSLKFPHE